MAATELYERLPPLLQHLATAAYGVHMRTQRRGGAYTQTRRRLAVNESLPAESLARIQDEEVAACVRHAVESAPYWRDTFARSGLEADAIRRVDDLRRLPILEKATVAKEFESLAARGVKGVRTYFTSGTSGTTLAVPIDDASRQRNYAFFSRALSWAGVEDARCATFAGRPVVSSNDSDPSTVWRWNPAMRNRLFSSYHIGERTIERYASALSAFRPAYIDSYPSAVFAVAQLAHDKGLTLPRLQAVITSSETLLENQREAIRGAFGAPCFDQYGCTEQSVYISQCAEGTYHVHPDYGVLEIVDANGDPVKPGEAGDVVCTSFTNDAFPLLRYRIGDVAVRGEVGCRCGLAFPVVREIVGRADDMLVTPDGRRIGRLDPVFKGRRTIVEAQIIQRTATEVNVRVVPGDGYGPADAEAVERGLRARLGPEMQIVVEAVESLERGASGKLRAVVNEHARSRRMENG